MMIVSNQNRGGSFRCQDRRGAVAIVPGGGFCGFTVALLLTAIATPWMRADEPLTFENQVRPILKAYCLDCHGGGEKLEGALDLRLTRFALRGGEGGPAIVVGKPAESLLIQRMRAGEMPPGEKKVPAEQLAIIERWIGAGAATSRTEPESLPPGIDITPEERAYWAFVPVKRPEPPAFHPADRVRTPIDAFILTKLREKGLSFAPDADKATLVRRAFLDLTGLPPTPAEVDAFVADTSDQAYDQLLDRLLNSPQYGERWGRHWLDIVGYSDSEGNGNEDTVRPYAYKYRDYVIRSLNADKPYDQFLLEQLAGDELVPRPWDNLQPAQAEMLAATGFLRMVVDGTTTGGTDEAAASNQVVSDALKVFGSAVLGLSVGCAQCHDHRYDPIPQVDYFRLRSVFEPAFDPAHWRRPGQRLVSLYTDADRAKAAAIEAEAQQLQKGVQEKTDKFLAAALEKELTKFPEEMRTKLRSAYQTPGDKRTEEQKQLLAANPSVNLSPGVLYQYDQAAADELKKDNEKVAAKRGEKPVEDFVSVLAEQPGVVSPTHLFHRGDYRQPTKTVTPGDLTITAPEGSRLEIPEDDGQLPTTGRRIALAKELTNGRHPTVGRVLANRLWLHHFGTGIVDTPGEFGKLGLRPSHPELLDWLADEVVQRGWRMKALHKLIMQSTVYRQANQVPTPSADAIAESQRTSLYGRYPLRRLDAEVVRDRVLAVSGRLDKTPFGPSVAVEEDFVGQVIPQGDSPRRSIYLQVRRTKPVSLLTTFDAPVMTVNCERRVSSTSAPQSLMLMNSDFIWKHAEHFAKRVRGETPADFAVELTKPFRDRFAQPASGWQYGSGAFDLATSRTSGFTPLPHWTGSSWQGGPQLPDPQWGWAIVHAQGGHAGNDAAHASIRRWTAPHEGLFRIAGQLQHPSANGDGVRGRLVSSSSGLLGEWSVLNQTAATNLEKVQLKQGDTLDFAVDCLTNVNTDSYVWTVEIASVDQPSETWQSAQDFQGPAGISTAQQVAFAWRLAYQRDITPAELELAADFLVQQRRHLRAAGSTGDRDLASLTNLCQQLISSNEFLYVD